MSKEEGDNSFGLLAVVFGVLGICFAIITIPAFFAPIVGFALSILGLIFTMKQKKVHKNKWYSWALWLSIIGLVINGFILFRFMQVLLDLKAQCDAAGGCNKLFEQMALQQAQSQLGGAA